MIVSAPLSNVCRKTMYIHHRKPWRSLLAH